MSDDINRRLRAARPRTPADDGWASSPEGTRRLAAISQAAADAPAGARLRMRVLLPEPGRRRRAVAYGLTCAAAVTALAVILTGPSAPQPSHPGSDLGGPPPGAVVGPRPHDMALVAYTDCSAMLAGLRDHTAAHVTEYGLFAGGGNYSTEKGIAVDDTAPGMPLASGSSESTPAHSTTNDQEIGADEPDLVKSDGDRIVTVSGGVLRVVDAATRKVTGTLDLTMYAGSEAAQLLVSGNRALVVLGTSGPGYPRIAVDGGGYNGGYPPANSGTGYLLVDLGTQLSVIGTLHPKGGYVDARLVGGTVRLVVQSSPVLSFPTPTGTTSPRRRIAESRNVVRNAPLSAWLPTYDVTSGGVTTKHSVPCGEVRHPASYTGESMLTVYSIDLAAGFDDVAPVSLAADGATVYATPASLYVASAPAATRHGNATTQVHRYDITGPGRPTYLGSGAVPGRLLSSYSLSDYHGHLRVVTTTGDQTGTASSAVYVLDADTLKTTGHVGGLGPREQVYAVRFLGALAYVVTYRSVDPLYVLDLSDPAKPRRAGELEMTGYSGYLHPTGNGRLLGVGNAVGADNEPSAIQISLFDVGRPSHPQRIDRVVRPHTPGAATPDPHAFLYWAAGRTAVVPIQTWNPSQSGMVLVLHVGTNDLRTVGTIHNPTTSGNGGIQRTFVIGDAIWTMSPDGIAVSDSTTLHRRAWIPFS